MALRRDGSRRTVPSGHRIQLYFNQCIGIIAAVNPASGFLAVFAGNLAYVHPFIWDTRYCAAAGTSANAGVLRQPHAVFQDTAEGVPGLAARNPLGTNASLY